MIYNIVFNLYKETAARLTLTGIQFIPQLQVACIV